MAISVSIVGNMPQETSEILGRRESPAIRDAIDLIPLLLACALPDGSVEFVNRAWREFTGGGADGLAQWGWPSVMPPEDLPEFLTQWHSARSEGKSFETVTRVRRLDGSYRRFIVKIDPLRDETGQIIRWFGAGQDIENLKGIEDQLRLAIHTSPALIHTSLPDGYLDYFNQTWLEYVGLPLQEVQGWNWTASIHPDDVQGIVDRWRACLASGEPFLYEARVRRSDGEYRWMLHHKVATRDKDGKILKWFGSSIDIHERKIAEEKIRYQELERRQMLDLAPQPIFVLGPDDSHVRLYANQAALDYYGQTLEEWQTSGRSAAFYPGDWERMLSAASDKIASGAAHEVEARIRRRDGQYRWHLFHQNPLRDEQGRVQRWFVSATDIEERKQAEERLQNENVALREEIDKASMFEEIVGTSVALQAVLSRVSKVAPTDSTALITGETGTGKELVARAIHRRSHRSSRAFISVNCSAIPRDLIASELFGHEKGAFTGATQRRIGRFELAGGGTIFLDEIGELTAETQVALLRVLQEHEFERVGGSRSIQTDVRVIAATNRDLQAAITAGTFRSDLFYRLNVFPIEIPALRERSEDIPMLVEYFLDRYGRNAGKNIRCVNKKTMELLQCYPWPGNIRELQNVVERSVILCETEDFSIDESWLSRKPSAPVLRNARDLTRDLALREREIIEAALRACGGRVFGPSGAAAKLGMPRSTLESKIRSLKINKNQFKS